MAPCGIGLGHITRSHPIANELNKRGIETIFSTYLDGLEYAKRNRLRALEAVPISFKVTRDGTIDFKRTAATSGFSLGIRTFLRQTVQEMRFIKGFKPDVVFSDSRASSLLAAWLLKIPVVLMLNQFRIEIIKRPSAKRLSVFDRVFFIIANLGWVFIRTAIQLVWVRSKRILIPDLPAPYTISVGNHSVPKRYNDKVKLIGPIIENPLTIRNQEKRSPESGSGKKLIYAAVSGPRIERDVLTQRLLGPLSDLSDQYNVVLSRGDPNGRPLKQTFEGVEVYDWIQEQDDFLNACDIVVSRAGHGVIMKSIFYGKPMVLIPIPDQTEQYSNAQRAVSIHLAELIDQNELNSDTLTQAVERIMGSRQYGEHRKRVKEVAHSLNAVASACETIASLCRNT